MGGVKLTLILLAGTCMYVYAGRAMHVVMYRILNGK